MRKCAKTPAFSSHFTPLFPLALRKMTRPLSLRIRIRAPRRIKESICSDTLWPSLWYKTTQFSQSKVCGASSKWAELTYWSSLSPLHLSLLHPSFPSLARQSPCSPLRWLAPGGVWILLTDLVSRSQLISCTRRDQTGKIKTCVLIITHIIKCEHYQSVITFRLNINFSPRYRYPMRPHHQSRFCNTFANFSSTDLWSLNSPCQTDLSRVNHSLLPSSSRLPSISILLLSLHCYLRFLCSVTLAQLSTHLVERSERKLIYKYSGLFCSPLAFSIRFTNVETKDIDGW